MDPTNTNLVAFTLAGTAKNSFNNDEAAICFGGVTCNYNSNTYTKLNLYQYWYDVEWNLFGLGGRTQANFNIPSGTGVSMSIQVNLKDSSGAAITPNCNAASYTGETANLNKSPGCTSNSAGWYSFSQSN